MVDSNYGAGIRGKMGKEREAAGRESEGGKGGRARRRQSRGWAGGESRERDGEGAMHPPLAANDSCLPFITCWCISCWASIASFKP